MTKQTVSTRLPEVLIEKIRQLARDKYGGDRSLAIIELLNLGIQAMEQGEVLEKPKYDLPEPIILAIYYEVGEQMNSHRESYDRNLAALTKKLENLTEQVDKKSKRAKVTE